MVLEQFEPHLSECSIGHPISFFISIFFSGKITPFYRQVFPYFDSDFFSRSRLSYWRYFVCVGQLRVDDSEKRSEVNVLFPLN